MLVKLTSAKEEVYVNPLTVTSISAFQNGTEIRFAADYTLIVSESLDFVAGSINDELPGKKR